MDSTSHLRARPGALTGLFRARGGVSAVDRRLLAAAIRAGSPRTDRAMTFASRAANRSRLWLAIAAVLAMVGGSRGRRAVARGLLSIGLTSAVVNGPIKLSLRRKRPAGVILGRPSLVLMPTSSSFPSGHSASAFGFASSVLREWPLAGVPLTAVATTVAYSRVYNGVHYPSDVVAGAGLGVGAAWVAGKLLRGDGRIALPEPEPVAVPSRVVFVTNHDSGNADALDAVRAQLRDGGFEIIRELKVEDATELAELASVPDADRPLVIAAGGDGTVGAAADQLAGTDAVIAILPLGTSNDVARSLGIASDPVRAAAELTTGVVRAIDVGQLVVPGQRDRHFVHAATAGLNVHFAELATQSTVRRRFGRLTYAVAGIRALRRHQPFDCTIEYDGTTETLRLVQLSVINAPVFGGMLDLRIPGARMDDRTLSIIAVEEGPALRLLLGGLLAVAGRRGEGFGVRTITTHRLHAQVDRPLDVSLDGEVVAQLPADFVVKAKGLRVVTPPDHVRQWSTMSGPFRRVAARSARRRS